MFNISFNSWHMSQTEQIKKEIPPLTRAQVTEVTSQSGTSVVSAFDTTTTHFFDTYFITNFELPKEFGER